MKKAIITFLLTIWILALFFLIARAEKIQLQWDYEGDVVPDGFRIFQKLPGAEYDFDAWIAEVPGDTRDVTIDLQGEAGAALKYEFVARAFILDKKGPLSNEVNYTVVRIAPPVPIDLSGDFDGENGLIHIAWTQPADDYDTHHWRVYYRSHDEPESDYTELGLIRRDNPLELTTEFNIVAQGERKAIDFVVIAYRRSGTFSGNSVPLTIDVDRREVGEIKNLRINIEIPVI